jgi:hypothetical protein
MAEPPDNTSFGPRPLQVGSDWYVQVTWPDGEVERVSGFRTEAEAKEWIDTRYRKWLLSQIGIRRPVKPK